MYDFLFFGNHFSVLLLVFHLQFYYVEIEQKCKCSIDLPAIHDTELIFFEKKKYIEVRAAPASSPAWINHQFELISSSVALCSSFAQLK